MKKLLTILVLFLVASIWSYSQTQGKPKQVVTRKSHEKVAPWDTPAARPVSKVSKEKSENKEQGSNTGTRKPK